MSNESRAKSAFSKARDYYESGLKSANKKYDDNSANVSWWKQLSGKARARNTAQPTAGAVISVHRSSNVFNNMNTIDKGQFLYDGKVSAGNCGELAQVCCYLLNKAGAPNNTIALAGVYTVNPVVGAKVADHAFCLYGPSDLLNAMVNQPAFCKLDYLNDARAYRSIYAIDPWANTCCTLDKYPGKVATKMESWGTYGKRVLWCYGPGAGDYGWYNPNGEYKTVFAAASLNVNVC